MKMPKLLQLAIENKAAPKAFEVKNAANGDAEIYLYDVIDAYWGVGASAFIAALNSTDAGTIHLHINSPGGDVFEARAMVAAIAASNTNIVAHIDGIAASAASYVAMACDSVQMADGAFFMIHNAWTVAMGNADDLRSSADLLAKVDGSIVADYMRKTGKDQAQIEQWMADETWFTAQEAVDNGFADTVITNEKGTKNTWNLAAYKKAPKSLLEAPKNSDISMEIEQQQAARDRHLALLERIA